MNVTRCCKRGLTDVTFAASTAWQMPDKLSGLTNIHRETALHLLRDCHTFIIRLPHICCETHTFVMRLPRICCETATHLLRDCHTFAARLPHICCETATHLLRDCPPITARLHPSALHSLHIWPSRNHGRCRILSSTLHPLQRTADWQTHLLMQ